VDYSSEEEQALELARYLNNLINKGKETKDESFLDQCTQLTEKNQHFLLLQKLTEQQSLVFKEAEEHEVEGYHVVLCSLVKKLGGSATANLLPLLVPGIISSKTERVLLRLQLLKTLYHTLSDINGTIGLDLFLAVIQYSGATNHVSVISEFFPDIDKSVKQFGTSIEQTRHVYKTIRDTHKNNKESFLAQQWAVKYLSTFEPTESNKNVDISSVTTESVETVLEAIRLPGTFQLDNLLELFAVKQLEKYKPKVFQLLKIFVSENLDAFNAFVSENPDFLKLNGLPQDDCIYKMRLLSLASLGSANDEIPYSLIQKTLQIEENEVESWIISAIAEKIIAAKIDQLRHVVIVTRCLQRIYSRGQWKQLSETLASWKTNVRALINTLQESKQQHFGAFSAQI